jgi:exo-beta-1,3-glucanase (GH17 family)
MFEYDRAICYSGYREGQSPRDGTYPSYAQIHEDLRILAGRWKYLRLYDPGPHAETVLRVIRDQQMDFRVMLGIDLAAETSNPNCPWGGMYSHRQLADNLASNRASITRAIELAGDYRDSVFSVSLGNEASVDWTDHLVPVPHLIAYARELKQGIAQPITFCENYVPWNDKLISLAQELDFISVHTYPVWEYKSIDEAMAYTRENYTSVLDRYPDKPVVITEAGWTTAANGRGIDPGNANCALQAEYYEQLMEWADREKILTFVFEAFDEPWKGSDDPLEPEKHWGLFRVDRTPKPAALAVPTA